MVRLDADLEDHRLVPVPRLELLLLLAHQLQHHVSVGHGRQGQGQRQVVVEGRHSRGALLLLHGADAREAAVVLRLVAHQRVARTVRPTANLALEALGHVEVRI